jgi:hypothetical protein
MPVSRMCLVGGVAQAQNANQSHQHHQHRIPGQLKVDH